MFRDHQIAYLRKHVRMKEVTRLNFLREGVAFVLSRSARTVPHAAAVAQYDVTPLVEYGKRGVTDQAGDEDARLQRAIRKSLSAFFLKAIAHSLYHLPKLNAFLEYAPWRSGGTLYVAEDINLSFTVHTKHGVLRPIVRNPHQRDLASVANDMRQLTRRARRTDPEILFRKAARAYAGIALRELDFRGLPALWMWIRSNLRGRVPCPDLQDIPEDQKLQVTDILGATCTVANIGTVMTGHQTVTVIIPPEVMMFGIGNIGLVPWIVDGEVVPRYVVTIVGTIDHRAIDGGDVFPIHKHFERYIRNPELIFDWKPGDPI